jgi:hypothetical protein
MLSRLNGTARFAIVCLAAIVGFVGLVVGWAAGEKAGSVERRDRENAQLLAADVPEGVVDETTGAYRGVARGDSVARVKSRLGEPIEKGNNAPFASQVSSTWNGIYTSECRGWRRRSGDFHAMVYREVVFMIVGGKVCSYDVAGNGWSTTGGIEAGDSIEDIRDRFGKEACYEHSYSEDPNWKLWTCTGHTATGIRMQFTGNPASTIAVG